MVFFGIFYALGHGLRGVREGRRARTEQLVSLSRLALALKAQTSANFTYSLSTYAVSAHAVQVPFDGLEGPDIAAKWDDGYTG